MKNNELVIVCNYGEVDDTKCSYVEYRFYEIYYETLYVHLNHLMTYSKKNSFLNIYLTNDHFSKKTKTLASMSAFTYMARHYLCRRRAALGGPLQKRFLDKSIKFQTEKECMPLYKSIQKAITSNPHSKHITIVCCKGEKSLVESIMSVLFGKNCYTIQPISSMKYSKFDRLNNYEIFSQFRKIKILMSPDFWRTKELIPSHLRPSK